ncbi:extracellular solute-binding protein family 1 [Beutenbergia cavernae DSM 12333]|uniref:Extracellular solute-binding protein family 1 n=1 Tax=Beutenbergia cavernae (strain ATCC BAA-8 / DSM 12333 / CCUG 43141 / JCM 11478 / NBRC 16432 / NCIMB 13614 / HKI 0122) TaxID=471853 RepID=C5BYV9_BEUC1|nr:extracellular solute-binding protein [Beutenbergia cavernae]ACQ79067.1 extracellular solute-binding protein family 1 [Beutenbergia cavernae DSM 12333]
MVTRRTFLRSSGVVLGAGAVGALAACGSDSGGEEDDGAPKDLRFAWWGHEEMHRTTVEALELYSSRHENVEITGENTSWDDFWDRMATQIAGGNGPDAFQMSNQMIVDYAQRGALLDLEEYVGDVIDLSDWDENLRSYGIIDGVRAGVPISTDAFTILADSDVLAELGLTLPEAAWTWDDLAELSLAVREASGGSLWGMSDGAGRYELVEPWVRGRGKTLFDVEADPVTLGFDKEDYGDFLQWWSDRRDEGACVPADVAAEDTSHETSPLVTGSAPLYFTTTSELTGVRALTPAAIQAVPMPDTDGGSKKANFVRPNLFMSAWTGTSYPTECARLIEFWINDPEAVEVIGNSRGVPPSPASAELVEDAPDASGLRTPAEYLALIREVGDPMDALTPRSGREVYQLMTRIGEEVRFGQTTVPAAVDSFFDQAASILGG